MNALLIISLLLFDVVLCIWSIMKRPDRGLWRRNRLIIRCIQVLWSIGMITISGAVLNYRYLFLMIILGGRFVIALFAWMIREKVSEKHVKIPGAIISLIVCAFLYIFAMVPAMVISDYQGLPVTGSYEVNEAAVIIADTDRQDPFEDDGSNREVPVHFYYPADVSGDDTLACPLVIFSHGAFGYYQSNSSTYMELASHGYVVAALDHPHHAFFTKDSDGKVITADQNFINAAMTLNGADIEEDEVFAMTSEWMALRTGDVNCVLDEIKAVKAEGSFSDGAWFFTESEPDVIMHVIEMTDCDTIGLMGHSLGGATAVALGRERDDITAVIDLDGTMLGEQKAFAKDHYEYWDEPYPVPVLAIDAENHHAEYEASKEMYVNYHVIATGKDTHETYFKGADHMNMTDLPLFSPFLAKQLGTGSIDPAHCLTMINGIVLNYYDHYLKGEGALQIQECYE